MALNDLFLEGRIETTPQRATSSLGHVEFVLRHESSTGRGVEYFPVEIYESLAELFGVQAGTTVLLHGSLTQRLRVERQRGDVRCETVISAKALKRLSEAPRGPSPLSSIADDGLKGSQEIPF